MPRNIKFFGMVLKGQGETGWVKFLFHFPIQGKRNWLVGDNFPSDLKHLKKI